MKIVKQRDELDCGVCCLASVIKHYKGNVPLEVIRLDAKTNNSGTSALNLILAAQKYGLDGSGLELESLKSIKKLPAIAHLKLKNGLNHYVVIYKITKDKVVVMDPGKGKVVKTKDEFQKEWSNVILVFYPKRKVIVLKNEITLAKLLFKFYRSEKRLINKIIIINILVTLFAIVGSYYFQVMVSTLSGNYPIKYVYYLVFVFALFVLFKMILEKMGLYLQNHLKKNISCVLYRDFFNHLYNLPLNAITSRKSGDIMRRVYELEDIKEIVLNILFNFTKDVFLILLVVPLLIFINKKLFLVFLIFLVIYLLISLLTFKRVYKLAYQNIDANTEFNTRVLEDIKMITSIKNINGVDKSLGGVEESASNYIYDMYKFTSYINRVNSLKFNVNEISLFFINTLGFYMIYKESMTVLQFVTFNSILVLFINPFKDLMEHLPSMSLLKASITKINEFLSIKEEKVGRVISLSNFDIKIENLDYTYNKYLMVISGLNLDIKMGEFVLIKGSSGCGKSTLCNILVKNIEDYRGNVLIGNCNLKNLSLGTIRSNILYINQNENLKTGTIYENIVLKRDVSLEYLEKIMDICEINKILQNKPLGLDTLINNDENSISGGEKERIILARGLLNSFNILILDEALSEVDLETEVRILNNLREEFKDKTIVFISHKKYKKMFDKEITLGCT